MEDRKTFPFQSLCFGFAYSPNLKANIVEVCRLAVSFGAQLELVHVGNKTEKKQQILEDILGEVPQKPKFEVHWKEGDPTEVILHFCESLDVDLLVLGALQKENLYKFYVGSIARNLTRKVHCSVMLMIKPSIEAHPTNHIVVNGLEAAQTPDTIHKSFRVAHALQSKQITVVEEIQPEKMVNVDDDRSLRKAVLMKERIRTKEYQRVDNIIQTVSDTYTKDIRIKTQSIFGKRGYSIGHYAQVVRADLLIMNAPIKTGWWDRIFTRDLEYILSGLPTDVLIIRAKN
ncbi:MAG: universal stress protein [Flavobacteriaceae bacterium]|nr:universal stress protein [Flavobacteriaceae bacterium]